MGVTIPPAVWGLLGAAAVVVGGLMALGVLSRRPGRRPVCGAELRPCPPTPNCVSSVEGTPEAARVAPLAVAGDPKEAWATFREVVAALPRTRIVAEGARWLHAESRSLLFGFVDDLEASLDAGARRIDVRAGARVGHSDLGANRRRVESLRATWIRRGGGGGPQPPPGSVFPGPGRPA